MTQLLADAPEHDSPVTLDPGDTLGARTGDDALSRRSLLLVSASLTLFCFVQSWGRIVDDTKLDLLMSPMTYMRDALHLWTPFRFFGSVESQTWGYLFPMGPFFAIGRAAHIPVWVTERAWLSLVVCAGFWGTVRLAEALRMGRPWTRTVAGLAYAVAPLTVTWASTSIALLTVAFLPWTIVPLVHGSRTGSPRRAAACSGLVFVLMGGVNAAVIAAVLPMPIIFLFTRQPGRRRRALAVWWTIALGLAFFWWLIPAAISGKYGFNYLPYTEKANLTTSTTSAFEGLRGTSFWVDYFNLGGPLVPGAWTLVSMIAPILGTTAVTAMGLFGLARKRTPERLFLVSSIGAGVAAIGAGYAGSLGSPFAARTQRLLDGPLVVFRNVSKFGPIVALPLALGLAAALSAITLPPGWRELGEGRAAGVARRTSYLAIGLVGAVVAFYAALAFWALRRFPSSGFSDFPLLWTASTLPVGIGVAAALSYLRISSNFKLSAPNDGPESSGSVAPPDLRIESRNCRSGTARHRTTYLAAAVVTLVVGFYGGFVLWAQRRYPTTGFSNFPVSWTVATLPLGLGVAVALSYLPLSSVSTAGSRERLLAAGRQRLVVHRQRLHIGIASGALLAVFLAATPVWSLRMYPAGAFAKYPSYWTEASDWLRAQHDLRTALVVPAASFAENTWGRPLDEPLGSVGKESAWSSRSLVVLSSKGNIQMMDAVEGALDSGVSPPGLASFLAREGVDFVVARNDLNLDRTGAPSPAQVHQVLAGTTGLHRVAQFGPVVTPAQAESGGLAVFDIPVAQMDLHAVDIYRVDRPGSMVETFPAQSPVVVAGDPNSLLAISDTGLLDGRAALLNGDPNVPPGIYNARQATEVVTDGNQRRDVSFGGIRNNKTFVLGQNQPSPLTKEEPQSFSLASSAVDQTVAAPIGAVQATASSYGSTLLVDNPAEGPNSAFDGDLSTAWVANAAHDSKGQWAQLDFGREVPISTVRISPLPPDPARPTVSAVRITTQRGSVVGALAANGRPTTLRAPAGNSSWLRVTLERVAPALDPRRRSAVFPGGGGALPPALQGDLPLGVGLRDVAITGLAPYIPTLQVPRVPQTSSDQPPFYAFSSPLTNANLSLATDQDEEPHMSRSFDVPASADFQISGVVTPRPGSALNDLLSARAPLGTTHISASSWLGGLPRFRPDNLLSTSGSPWIAERGDASPYVDISWAAPIDMNSIVLVPSAQGSSPSLVSITSSAGSRLLTVPPGGGILNFAPLNTNSVRIRILRTTPKTGAIPSSGLKIPLPPAVERLVIPALRAASVPPLDAARTFSLPCGQGPPLNIDGSSVPTGVSGTVGDLVNLAPLRLTSCIPSGVQLGHGHHVLASNDQGGAFKITAIIARDTHALPPAAPLVRSARILSWGTTRTIAVTAGPDTYLRFAENYNLGWRARLDHLQLQPVELDGWQQGWKVPAGAAGTVTITYPPDHVYRSALGVGACLLVILAVLALLPWRRRSAPPPSEPRVGAAPLLALAAAAVMVVVGGYLALLLVPLLLLGWRHRDALAYLAACSFLAGGIAVTTHPAAVPGTATGAFGAPAQFFAVLSLGAVAAALVVSAGVDDFDRAPLVADPKLLSVPQRRRKMANLPLRRLHRLRHGPPS